MFNPGKMAAVLLFGTLMVALQCAQVVQATSGGKVYALGFFNLSNGDPYIFGPTSPIFEEIMISCFQCTTQVVIRVPGLNYTSVVPLDSTNGWNKRIQLNQDIATAIQFPTGLKWMNAAVTVVSLNASINVHVNKARPGSGAAYLAIPLTYSADYMNDPTNVIFNYFAASYTTVGNSVVSIVSLFNNTCVQVLKSSSIIYQDLTLQANEVFNMYADATSSDFTAIQVTSRKPVGVFTGVDNAQIPVGNPGYDAIMEQIPRLTFLQTKPTLQAAYHILTSIPGMPNSVGFEYRIIGATSASTVQNVVINEYSYASVGSVPTLVSTEALTVKRNTFVNRTAGIGNTQFTVVVISCNTSCLVSQYLYGNGLSGGSNHPDPAMVVAPPVFRYTKDITFSTSRISDGASAVAANNFITIVANSASYLNLILDSTAVTSILGWSGWYAVDNPLAGEYYVGTVPITDGFHTLTTNPKQSADAYDAYVFGFGSDPNLPTAYAYMAAVDIPDTDVDPPAGPWYSLPNTGTGQAAATGGTNPASGVVLANEIRPSYGLILLANFTALNPAAAGKVADRTCANTYAQYFIYRIQNLAYYVTSNSPIAQFLNANAPCRVTGISITVAVRNITDSVYYSEYSRSAGSFSVNITGSGSATLRDVFYCAKSVSLWVQNTNNWISGSNGDTTNFLRKDNPDFSGYQTLQDSNCAVLYLSNSNGLLPIYSQGWVCPLTSTSVFGSSRATSCRQFATTTTLVALLVSAFVALMFR